MFSLSRACLNNMLAVSAGATIGSNSIGLDNCRVGLYKQPFGPTVDTTLAELEAIEADYPGYARHAIAAWNGPFIAQNGKTLVADDAIVFQATGDDSTNTIYGQFLIGSDSVTYLGAEPFNTPISLGEAGRALVSTPIVGLPPDQVYGASIVSG